MNDLCGGPAKALGVVCIRKKGHSSRCWSKWEAVPGSPGYVSRAEWTLGGGVYGLGYISRKVVDDPPPPADEGEGSE